MKDATNGRGRHWTERQQEQDSADTFYERQDRHVQTADDERTCYGLLDEERALKQRSPVSSQSSSRARARVGMKTEREQ